MNLEMTKVTFKVYPPVWARLSERLKDLCLNRDAFFSKLIKCEITELENELRGKPQQSAKAKNFLSQELVRLGNKHSKLTPISIQMPKATATALREIVEKHNLYRDGLFNRICVFLDISDAVLKHFSLPTYPDDSIEEFSTRPLLTMDQTQSDPFYFFRKHLLQSRQAGIYTVSFPPNLKGISCYIEDHEAPNTTAFKKSEELRQLLLNDSTIDDAFSN
jgi:hypothetical protein